MATLSYSQKMGITAGSAALLSPVVGQATIIHFDNSNAFTVTVGNGSAEWDVDGGGQSDFVFTTSTTFDGYIYMGSNGGRNGRGVVQQTPVINANRIQNLASGFTVGSALTPGFQFGPSGLNRSVVSGSIAADPFVGAGPGSNFIGFALDIAGGTHYGWAELIIGSESLTINQWAYNDVANGSINVADFDNGGSNSVPEPTGLALLAAGAAGIARVRRRQKIAA